MRNNFVPLILSALFLIPVGISSGLAATIDGFVEFQNIPANGVGDWEFFTIDGDSYLALTHHYDNGNHNLNSKIYKWNGTAFAEFQSIPTSGANGFRFFTINNDIFLASANTWNNSTNILDSIIYKWNGALFSEFQSIPTSGGRSWEFFSIDGEFYLAINNFQIANNFNIDSMIYKWDGASFTEFQPIPTTGGYEWEYFTINGESYLAVSNFQNESTYNLDSKIYKWDGALFVEHQVIPTSGPMDFEFFTIAGDSFLGVANFSDDNTFNIDSKIYKWNGSLFIEYQAIPTNGARDLEFFTFGNEIYLGIANFRNGNLFSINSKVYQWDGSEFFERFLIPTTGAADLKFFEIDGEPYLAAANQYDGSNTNHDSKIFKAGLTCVAPSVDLQPADAVVCHGQSVTFDIGASGEAPLTYQWRHYGENISGATDPVFTMPAVGPLQEGIYDCLVSNACGQTISNPVSLAINPPMFIQNIPDNATRCEGESVSFEIIASGLNLQYQWRFEGVDIPGATNSIYALDQVSATDAGAYDCRISDGCDQIISTPVSLTLSTGDFVNLSLPRVSAPPGEFLAVPIRISNVADIESFTFGLDYDSSLMQFISLDQTGTLTENWSIAFQASESSVMVSGNIPLAGLMLFATAVSGHPIKGVYRSLQMEASSPGTNLCHLLWS